MNDRKRRQLLEKIRRPSGTLGTDLPAEITVQGTEIDLTEFVFECKRLETIPDEERDRIEEMKRKLRRERLARKQRLVREDISETEGERLVQTILGLDRALTALDGLDEPSIGEQIRRKKLEDARELLSLINQQP
ncbi:hypothetical protein C477_06061 [Haloterrigena salina JCM 13891]|uniref:Uncharacterized protein n=1 Tax=Haloterrigena salina JCM 13891 TaxID=1227488 RepID=M0CEK0_9EURY|nr:DUF5788 family protein [Haloterrigena salina]ELZ20792.1 hypothetical protein C477_06061 [Haloterrigena salina JCM 13891]